MCKPLSDDQMEDLAERVAGKMAEKRKDREDHTRLTPEETVVIQQILATKKRAVQIFFLVFTAALLWALKDIYGLVKGVLKSVVIIKGGS